ncbi:hypothetical protein ACHAXN_004563 [Cyclotella atomus]
MAQPLPRSTNSGKAATDTSSKTPTAIWGVDSNTAGGGVWAQTSAKKDKLNELLTDLNGEGIDTGKLGMESLDLAANPEQKLDLEFADGLKCLAKFIDKGISVGSFEDVTRDDTHHYSIIQAMQSTSQKTKEVTQQLCHMIQAASSKDSEWARPKFEATMNEAVRILSLALPQDPSLKKPTAGNLDMNNSLCYIRDFITVKSQSGDDHLSEQLSTSDMEPQLQTEMEVLQQITTIAFGTSIHIYKIFMLRALANTLLQNWDQLISITSGDIDRAAVNHDGTSVIPSQRDTVNAQSIQQLFTAYESSACAQFVESWWNLLDADGDGLIDQEEMNTVVDLAMKPVHMALKEMVDLSLEVCPARRVGLVKGMNPWFLGGDNVTLLAGDDSSQLSSTSTSKLSWRNRRSELAARKLLTKTFAATLIRHFRDQVETPHRLRCIYAWAEKAHQDNKIDSILVDASEEWGAASSIVGRKRYVELEPKISYQEFRDVQKKHFPQLDSIGEEIMMSFKEDLWVLQGKGRQNAELRRDCFLFLAAVSLIDVGICLL